MPLQTLVKLNEVRSLAEARYGAGMGVDMLGFALEKHHPHHITPAHFQGISKWLSGARLVGEINTRDPKAIEQLLKAYSLDCLQLHDVPVGSLCDWGVPILIKMRLGQQDSLDMLKSKLASYGATVSYFLLEIMEGSEAGSVQSVVGHLAKDFPVIQSFSYVPVMWPHSLTKGLKGVAIKHTADELDLLVAALEGLTL